MNKRTRTPREIGFYVFILIMLVSAAYLLMNNNNSASSSAVEYSEMRRLFEDGDVEYFTIYDDTVTMLLKEDYGDTKSNVVTHKLMDFGVFYADLGDTIDTLMVSNEDFAYDYEVAWSPWWLSWLPYLLILVLFFIFWSVMMNKNGGMGGDKGIAKFSKARTRLGSEEKKRVTFADVAGAEEEKEELKEIVDFLKNPGKFTALGARIPKGVLLVGPPGTGKTLIAKAVAGEAGVQFLSISGSDFVELYVGVGASRVRDLFNQAKKLAPSIIFIDEIDAVGRQRGAGLGGGHDEREQTLNQLLVEMDGFTSNEGVIVMAATNRSDILDNALLRPGRFDRQVYVGVPDIRGREAILKVHARGKMIGEDVDFSSVAKGTPGFTGADLENLMNEAALLAARRNKRFITMAELDEATLKVLMGPEKKSRVVTATERRLTAYHEAGHAVASFYLEHVDPVHQITIIPRGQAGGMTVYRPQEDKSFNSRNEMFERIISALGGRVAEKLFIGDISTGASGDIQQATALARAMVTKYGMSDRLGPISYDDSSSSVFIGRDFSQRKAYSEETAAAIDAEIKSMFDTAMERCEQILNDHRELLITTAEYLLEHESLDGHDFAYMCQHNGQLPEHMHEGPSSWFEDIAEPPVIDDIKHEPTAEQSAEAGDAGTPAQDEPQEPEEQ